MSARQDMWSRRKAAVRAEAEALERDEEAAMVAQERAALEEKTDTEILQDLDLPDPGEMGEGDDFTDFMKSAVPERLRRRALRKLWVTNPALASVDELVEYGEDFTDAGVAVEVIKTAYQVGAGMLKHVQEVEKQQAKAQAVVVDDAESEIVDETESEDFNKEPVGSAPLTEPTMDADDETDGNPGLCDDDHADRETQDMAQELSALVPGRDDQPDAAEPCGVVRRKMRFEFAG